MKSYIKPEVKVYKVRIEPLLSGSGPEDGQIGWGLVKKYDPSLDEENDDGQTGRDGLWDDEDFED